jgi:hypothetical protein
MSHATATRYLAPTFKMSSNYPQKQQKRHNPTSKSRKKLTTSNAACSKPAKTTANVPKYAALR